MAPDSTADQDLVWHLLSEAEAAATWAEAQDGDAGTLTRPEDAPPLKAIYKQQQFLRPRLIEAGNAVGTHDFRPRLTPEDIMPRVRVYWEVCAQLIAWIALPRVPAGRRVLRLLLGREPTVAGIVWSSHRSGSGMASGDPTI